jgi:hypothetical protein
MCQQRNLVIQLFYDPKIPLHVIGNYQSRQGLQIGSTIDEWELFVPLGTTHAG